MPRSRTDLLVRWFCLERLAARRVDLLDPDRAVVAGAQGAADAPAALDEGLVGVGHVERRDALLEAAERHRVVRRDRRADAHALGQRGDLLRPDGDAHRREDGVVGVGQAARERLRARVLALEVVDDELLLAPGARDGEDALARRPQRAGRVALLQRRGEDERLDRRARLALALGGEVERARRVVAPADHRAHLAALVVDGDHGGRRPGGVGQVLVDRLLGRRLELEVERRVHLEPALERLAGAELVDQLLADPGREVRRLGPHRGGLDVDRRREGLDAGVAVLAQRQQALVEHVLEHEVAPRQGRLRDGRRGRRPSGWPRRRR